MTPRIDFCLSQTGKDRQGGAPRKLTGLFLKGISSSNHRCSANMLAFQGVMAFLRTPTFYKVSHQYINGVSCNSFPGKAIYFRPFIGVVATPLTTGRGPPTLYISSHSTFYLLN